MTSQSLFLNGNPQLYLPNNRCQIVSSNAMLVRLQTIRVAPNGPNTRRENAPKQKHKFSKKDSIDLK